LLYPFFGKVGFLISSSQILVLDILPQDFYELNRLIIP
jgi:hypothetical protein